MSDEASRRKRIIVILIVVIVVYASIYLYIRIQQDRIYNVDITVKPGSLVVKQGEELPFYINSNGAGVPFDVNAYTYLSGLRLDYLGLNDSGSASGSQCFALVKFNLSGSDPDVTAYWNGTIVYLTNSGPRYYLAPAGYYLIGQIVESSPDTRGNVFMNFTVPHETIFVSGLYLNYYLNLTNDTLGLTLTPIGTNSSGNFSATIVSDNNGTASATNVGIGVLSKTYIKFEYIMQSPEDSIKVMVRIGHGTLYTAIGNYGGPIAQD